MLGYRGVMAAQQAVGTIFDTYTTSKSVINPQALWVVPAGFLQTIGTIIEVDVWGSLNTLVTTPGTITFEIKCGPTANIVVFTTGAIQMNATAHTLLPFHLKAKLTLQAVGSGTSAKFLGMSELSGVMFTKTIAATDLWGRVSAADAAVGEVTIQAPITSPAQGTGFDSTVANIWDFWVGFSVSSASNRVRIDQYTVETLN